MIGQPGRDHQGSRLVGAITKGLSDPAREAAREALAWRDQALEALDAGDPGAALAMASGGLATLEAAGLGDGLEAAAVLLALAEIQEGLDQFPAAAATITRAITLLRNQPHPN